MHTLPWISFGIIFTILMANSCRNENEGINNQSTQGIKGKVVWVEGNQMPGPDKTTNGQKPVEREIHIYSITPASKAVSQGPFYTRIGTKLIKKVNSDVTGSFSVELPAGQYSVFTKEEDGLYANRFDSENNIQPVVVEKGKYTEIQLTIDYNAVF